MFRKLRWQFIGTVMVITAAILFLSFVTIYTSAAHSFRSNSEFRPGRIPPRIERLDHDTRNAIDTQRKMFAEQSLRELTRTLIVVGVVTMLVVFIISHLVADRIISGIEASYLRQRRFIGNASHELRTPLATIDANLDAAIADSLRPSKWLLRAKNESERMAALTTNLLLLAGLDDQVAATPVAPERINLQEFIDDCVLPFREQIAARKLHLSVNITADDVIVPDAKKLHQLMTILLDNATKYTPSKGNITVSSRSTDDATIISVENSFHLIDTEELTNYFERFYQADSSHHESGSGLGLAIAKELAASMRVELTATSTDDALLFEIVILKNS